MEFEEQHHQRAVLIEQLKQQVRFFHKEVYGQDIPDTEIHFDPELLARAVAQIETDS